MEKLIIAMMLLLSPPAMAVGTNPECKYDGSQIEMNECAKRDHQEADAALNRAYYDKLKSLALPAQREALTNKQRDWIKRRDARCQFKKDEGSNATINHLTCLQSMTEIRTLQLR